MAVALPHFSDWLGNKLKDLNTDENVFGDYITGILDSDESHDEKNEALQDLLSEIVKDHSINDLCAEIMDMWVQFKEKEVLQEKTKPIEVDIKLNELADTQCLQTKEKKYTAEEKKIREAILAQYSQMSDDEQDEADGAIASGFQKNTNSYNVAQAEKEKRENAKLESQKKKEKDKEDRAKQQQMKDDKKEKRKTQKGERRR